jgi:hypothetical protein
MLLQLERCGLKVEVDPETSQGFFIAIRCPMGSEARVSEHVGRNFFWTSGSAAGGAELRHLPDTGDFLVGAVVECQKRP